VSILTRNEKAGVATVQHVAKD